MNDYIGPFWVSFLTRQSACVEAATAEDAMRIAKDKTGVIPSGAKQLPYPAEPRLNTHEFTRGDHTYKIPSFCFRPAECQGLSSWLRQRACDD